MKKGFTLVELLVVVAMLMILVGAVTTSVSGARKRAKISQATALVKELTNALLAYEQYAAANGLEITPIPNWVDATADNLNYLLGKGPKGKDGSAPPVFYNAAIKGKKILDPWGNPIKVKIEKSTFKVEDKAIGGNPSLGLQCPNFYRRPAWEVR